MSWPHHKFLLLANFLKTFFEIKRTELTFGRFIKNTIQINEIRALPERPYISGM